MVEGKGFVASPSRLSAYLAENSRRQTALDCPLEPFRVPIRPHFRQAAAGTISCSGELPRVLVSEDQRPSEARICRRDRRLIDRVTPDTGAQDLANLGRR